MRRSREVLQTEVGLIGVEVVRATTIVASEWQDRPGGRGSKDEEQFDSASESATKKSNRRGCGFCSVGTPYSTRVDKSLATLLLVDAGESKDIVGTGTWEVFDKLDAIPSRTWTWKNLGLSGLWRREMRCNLQVRILGGVQSRWW